MPVLKDDALLRGRICWAAKQHGLPSRTAQLIEESGDLPAQTLRSIPSHSMIGEPVLLFTTVGADWTLLGCRGAGGQVNGLWTEALYSEIEKLSPAPAEGSEASKRKLEMDTLYVSAAGGKSLSLRATPGTDLFALWNIVLRLSHVDTSAA